MHTHVGHCMIPEVVRSQLFLQLGTNDLWYHAVANAGVQKILLLLLKGPNPLPETGVSIAKTARLLLFLQ